MNIYEKQKAVIDKLNHFSDCFDQYGYLVMLAGEYPGMPDELKKDDYLVRGCQSLVWLKTEVSDDILHVQADSDTLILKGILSLIIEIADGSPIRELSGFQFCFLEDTGLDMVFESDRQTGIKKIYQSIYNMS